jgi:hypothetical protein
MARRRPLPWSGSVSLSKPGSGSRQHPVARRRGEAISSRSESWRREGDDGRRVVARVNTPRYAVDVFDTRGLLSLNHYRRLEPSKRRETSWLIERIGIDLVGARVLDLGPGYGSALAEMRTHGAQCHFIERDVFFYGICRMRRFTGRLDDFVQRPTFGAGFAFMFAKGSVNPGSFRDKDHLREWLESARQATRVIALCPWVGTGEPAWFTDTLSDYGFAEVAGWRDSRNPEIYPKMWLASA